jgi:hypothetical protein
MSSLSKAFAGAIPTLILCLSLVGCTRQDDSTWHCRLTESDKTAPVERLSLQGATLSFQHQTWQFCGSLGLISYFDGQCAKDTAHSALSFNTSEGELHLQQRSWMCEKL